MIFIHRKVPLLDSFGTEGPADMQRFRSTAFGRKRVYDVITEGQNALLGGYAENVGPLLLPFAFQRRGVELRAVYGRAHHRQHYAVVLRHRFSYAVLACSSSIIASRYSYCEFLDLNSGIIRFKSFTVSSTFTFSAKSSSVSKSLRTDS